MSKIRCGGKTQSFLMNATELVKAVFGDFLFGCEKNVGFNTVSIDSRSVKNSSLFVPLRGKNLDGHAFIEEAVEKGAEIVLVDSLYVKEERAKLRNLFETYGTLFIVVENTLKALQDSACFYLSKINLKLKIGITGSSGKTTCKEMIGSLFSQKYNTFVSEGNLNSETGLPLSIFMLKSCHEVGVFELGMNRKGEIGELASVLSPDVAIITNIGTAHIGMLGTRQAIACEKKEIFSHFNHGSIGFIPDCSFTPVLKDVNNGKMIVYGASHLEEVEKVESMGLSGSLIKYKGEDIKIGLPGKHNVENAILAITVGQHFGFRSEEIKNALETMKVSFGRSEVRKGFITCFFDCYNANPESMSEAINFSNSLVWNGRKIAILGSMLELGDASLEEHARICEKVFVSNFDILYFFGDEMLAGLASYLDKNHIDEGDVNKVFRKKVFLYKDKEFATLKNSVADVIEKCDFVLLKASRGLALERLEDVLLLNS